MVTAAFVGCVTAYYFGLRAGAYAAAATFVLTLVAFFFPGYATALNLAIAVATLVIWQMGSRRPIPPESALAAGRVRAALKRLFSSTRRR